LERGDRQPPRALARETPVGTGFEHAAQAISPPLRNKPHAALLRIDRVHGALPQSGTVPPAERSIDPDEPLLGRAEDDRRLAAPVVRVAVGEEVMMVEVAGGAQVLDDGVVCRS